MRYFNSMINHDQSTGEGVFANYFNLH